MTLFALPGLIASLLSLVMLGLKIFALVDAATHRAEAYPAADKQTKTVWLIILGLSVAAQMLIRAPLSLLNLVGIVAAIVYLVDVRPALRSLTHRGR